MEIKEKVLKEIKELNTEHAVRTGLQIDECNDNNCVAREKLRILRGKIEIIDLTLAEVHSKVCNKCKEKLKDEM